MGQVNLYKIDENKRIGFLDQLREKFELRFHVFQGI